MHYNFFRPHEALGDRTPAEKAGIKFLYKNWMDVVKGAKTVSQETKEEDKPQPKVTFACASPVSLIKPKRSQKAQPTRRSRERQVSVGLKGIRI